MQTVEGHSGGEIARVCSDLKAGSCRGLQIERRPEWLERNEQGFEWDQSQSHRWAVRDSVEMTM